VGNLATILTRCGYRCDLCLAYKPNIEKNPANRQILSDGWHKYFGFRLPPEKICCDGCMSTDPHLIDDQCPVRPCVIDKGLDNCAQCEQYGCEKLTERLVWLEEIVQRVGGEIPQEDYQGFIRPYENRRRLEALRTPFLSENNQGPLAMSEPYEQRIRDYITRNAVQAEHLSFEQSCHSVAEAAEAAGAVPEDFVKNICLLTPDEELVVVIVKGEDRVSLLKVADALGVDGKMRLATPSEILAWTGYPCGGTPSFGFAALFLIDERVFEKEVVFTGGGSESSLIKVSPDELRRANQGIVAHLRK